jgi:cellulose synthase/poly-beta-1,6-N-acetylglucosamine synthase-like glycosyltransferase
VLLPLISVVIISKVEEGLDDTLSSVSRQATALGEQCEIVVVDASCGRLDHIWRRHKEYVRWLPFQPPAGVTVSIPHQRNAGVRSALGEIIVSTDAGCMPEAGWLARLTAPLHDGEIVTAGLWRGLSARPDMHEHPEPRDRQFVYLETGGTGNLAFRRAVFDAVGGFDERFEYGSDTDFTWRLVDAGYRIRYVPDAVIRHDFGTWRRQLRRSYVYGKSAVRLYAKHPSRLRRKISHDPAVVAYPVFLLALPLTLIFPFYPALLLIPLWRNRSRSPAWVVANNLVCGVGTLAELARGRRSWR